MKYLMTSIPFMVFNSYLNELRRTLSEARLRNDENEFKRLAAMRINNFYLMDAVAFISWHSYEAYHVIKNTFPNPDDRDMRPNVEHETQSGLNMGPNLL